MTGPPTRRGPIDTRLWRHAPTVRAWTAASVAVGVGLTGCLVAQAAFLARALTAATGHDTRTVGAALIGLAAATAARAALSFGAELTAATAAGRTKAQLRSAGITRLLAGAPASLAGHRSGELTVALGHGLDALDVYLGRYLPRLVLAVLAPVILVAWIAHLDWLSAAILAVTLILLPVFMVLVGQATQARVAKRWEALTRLSGHFLDAVEGLATLRAFGRARAQRQVIAEATDRLRRTTLGTLRVAFLSALVLETLAAVGTALVAVPLGLRLIDGRMTLAPALAILILTPEVYLPLRRASAEFHASTEGTAAAGTVLALLDDGTADTADQHDSAHNIPTGPGRCGGPGATPQAALALDDVSVTYPGRDRPAVSRITVTVASGEHLAIVGPSGAGKSTVAAVAAGLLAPTSGRVLAGGNIVDGPARPGWRARVAWVPQRPTIFSGPLADNLRLAAPAATDAQLWDALDTAGLAHMVAGLPGGLAAHLAEFGATLSAGERQRLGLARALLRVDAELVILDEPTAHLDPDREAAVVDGLRRALAGRAALIVTHRQRPLELADRVLTIHDGTLHHASTPGAPQAVGVGGSGRAARVEAVADPVVVTP